MVRKAIKTLSVSVLLAASFLFAFCIHENMTDGRPLQAEPNPGDMSGQLSGDFSDLGDGFWTKEKMENAKGA